VNPEIFGGTPIVRGRRLAVEHVLAGRAANSALEIDDLQVVVSVRRVVTAPA
jgi:uncharacterized protein (DUF433 family)